MQKTPNAKKLTYGGIFEQFMTVEKACLSKGYWNPKMEIGGNCAFFLIFLILYSFKIHNNMGFFSKLKLDNAWLPPLIFLGFKSLY